MKTFVLFTVLSVFALGNEVVHAQDNKPTVLKVSYVTSPLSAKMTAIIKAQIPDPQQYAAYVQQLSNSNMYHTLYVDTKTNESVYKLDSIKQVKGMNLAGQVDFCYKDPAGNFTGQEAFTGSTYYFNGKVQLLKWNITKETKTVGKYTCTKATLKNSPDVSAWFTTQISISNGPEYYFGLPGLVIECDNYFESCSISKLTYTNDRSVLAANMAKLQGQVKGKTVLLLQNTITSKQNFITMAENKMKQSKPD